MSAIPKNRPDHDAPEDLEVLMPSRESAAEAVDQDEEWCEVHHDGRSRRVRLHDYDEIFQIPGLYERIFYEELECQSPQAVRSLLEEQIERESVDPSELTVLDVGAGNGMVGEELADLGVGAQVAIDIIEEAAMAAERDRPGTYEDYIVADLTDLPAEDRTRLEDQGFNCLTTVAALGFGDIPPEAFAQAFNFVEDGGWIAFNIKDEFLGEADSSGFSRLAKHMLEAGILELRAKRRYRHRFSMLGEPLHYFAMVAVKRGDVPEAWVREAELDAA